MKPPCEVCGGARAIRLPLRRPLVAAMMQAEELLPTPPDEYSREYPCPECSATELMPFSRLNVRRLVATGRAALASEPEYIEAVKRDLAREIAMFMLREGMIKFTRGVDDNVHFEFPMTATVGVVAPEVVATFEHRVRERQLDVAQQMINLTEEQIRNWGSYYRGRERGTVEKWQALDWLREAYRNLKERIDA